jgi:ABC-type Na+ transport system ATPase subunit NatA
LLVGTTAAITVLIAFLARSNVVLTREVKKRTQTLEEEEFEMKSYLEKVQNELSKHR